MKFKTALVALTIAAGFSGASNATTYNFEQCKRFSESQIETLKDAWFAGADRDYGWTLAAIVWKESSAGEKLVNPAGPAYGAFQNLSSTVTRRLHQQGVKITRRQVEVKLMTDFGFAAEMAMAELDYWKGRHNGNWNKAVQSYYGGNTPNSPVAIAYREDIVKKIKFLRNNGCIFNDDK